MFVVHLLKRAVVVDPDRACSSRTLWSTELLDHDPDRVVV